MGKKVRNTTYYYRQKSANRLSKPIKNTALQKPIHKNSKEYVGETHVYRIVDENGKTHKIGQSALGVRKDGESKRARAQAIKLTNKTGNKYRTFIIKNFESKIKAHDYEAKLIERFRKIYGPNSLPGNKNNH